MTNHRWAFAITLCGLWSTISVSKISATPLTGSQTIFYLDIDMTFEPFNLPLPNGTAINTGIVTVALDTTHPQELTLNLNFDTGTAVSHTNLLISSPALAALGQPPQMLAVTETGTFSHDFVPDSPGSDTGTLILTNVTLNGGGTFGPGQLLTGYNYSNARLVSRDSFHETTKPDGTKETEKHHDVEYNAPGTKVTTPVGSVDIQPTGGGGKATVGNDALPEPASIFLVVTGLVVAVGWNRLKRRPRV